MDGENLEIISLNHYVVCRYLLLNIIFRNYHSHIHENTCSPINYQLKTFSTSKILGMIARERAKTTASVMAKSLIQVDISSNISTYLHI